MIRIAAAHGIVVFLDPIETGGWLDVLRDNGEAKNYAYGEWLGQRYKSSLISFGSMAMTFRIGVIRKLTF